MLKTKQHKILKKRNFFNNDKGSIKSSDFKMRRKEEGREKKTKKMKKQRNQNQ